MIKLITCVLIHSFSNLISSMPKAIGEARITVRKCLITFKFSNIVTCILVSEFSEERIASLFKSHE